MQQSPLRVRLEQSITQVGSSPVHYQYENETFSLIESRDLHTVAQSRSDVSSLEHATSSYSETSWETSSSVPS